MTMLSKIEAPDGSRPRGGWRDRIGGRWRKGALVVLPIAAIAGGILVAAQDAPPPAPPPAPVVTVAQPLVTQITEWDDYVGRFEASQAVEVRPRVSGALRSIHFKDGDIVRRGQLLFVIDPRPFEAALAEARAREASAASQLALARNELARASRLIDDQAISAEEVDTRRAAVRAGEAALAAARAQVRLRALDVEFTRVRAPITGRVSDRRVDIGNLVAGDMAGSATLLTTIFALDPIYFSFDGSEALYLKQQRQRQQGGAAEQTVQIRLQDEADYSWTGRVDFTDNAIERGSGTVRARAVVANPDYFLTPGMFGDMRLSSGQQRTALLVPDAAVQIDQARRQLLVVAADGTVQARPVQTGPRIGTLRAIRAGIGPRDRVVIAGGQLAQPGTKAQLRAGRIDPPRGQPGAGPITPPAASQATLAR